MRTPWLLCLGTAAALTACEDKSGNHTFPDTALDEVPAAISNQGHVRITFRALGNANQFVCRLDGGDPSMCISPFEADVQDGEHTFEVAAALNQNVDDTPATYTWRIDTVKPETVLVAAPPALDNATNPTFTFSGTDAGLRAAAVTFECALDGGEFSACASPHGVTVSDGAHSFAVRAKDAAGNVDPTPAAYDWTVDTTAPDTTITNGPDAGSTSPSSGAFEFSSPEPGAMFECAFDGAAFAACTSPKAFTLPSGSHTFAVRAKDAVATVDPSPAMRTLRVGAGVAGQHEPARAGAEPQPRRHVAAAGRDRRRMGRHRDHQRVGAQVHQHGPPAVVGAR